MPDLKILGIAGSLRQASYNRALLREARSLVPPGVALEIYEGLEGIPPFNQDLEGDGGPDVVRAFKAQVRDADALLIATPEYNYGIPGVLKNAIDWLSRPALQSPLRHKPIALVGASGGAFGTVRSQLQLRQVLLFTDSRVLVKPEFYLPLAHQHFDAQGRLISEDVRTLLRAVVGALVDLARERVPA